MATQSTLKYRRLFTHSHTDDGVNHAGRQGESSCPGGAGVRTSNLPVTSQTALPPEQHAAWSRGHTASLAGTHCFTASLAGTHCFTRGDTLLHCFPSGDALLPQRGHTATPAGTHCFTRGGPPLDGHIQVLQTVHDGAAMPLHCIVVRLHRL